MKTRILFNKDGVLLDQPKGYTPMHRELMSQYNAACRLCNPRIEEFNKKNDPEEMGEEAYEARYAELFLECLNSVPDSVRYYRFTSYDLEECTYEPI